MKTLLTSSSYRVFSWLVLSSLLFLLLPLGIFAQTYTLTTITKYGGGPSGTVSIEPLDFTCASSSIFGCSYPIAAGTSLTLVASAPAGASFINWFDGNGSTVGTSPIYANLTMNGNQTLQANFQNTSGPYTLTVYKGVPGLNNGSVSGTAGFFCANSAGSASQNYANGTVVILTNTPAPNWTFSYWEYQGNRYTNNTFTNTITGDTLVQAVFIHNDQPPVVNITAPVNNASNWVCTPLAITATASDPDGWISKLEFFQDDTNGTKIGDQLFAAATNGALATGSAWWKTDVLATNTFIVLATDNSGSQALSSPVTVATVLPPLHYLIVYGITTQHCELCMNGLTGHVYSVLGTTNIAPTNAVFWTNLGNMSTNSTPPGSNVFLKFFDPSVNLPRRFYRAQQQ